MTTAIRGGGELRAANDGRMGVAFIAQIDQTAPRTPSLKRLTLL